MAALALVAVAALAATVREARPAMGTVVGVTVRTTATSPPAEAAFALAFAEIARWEALLSPWSVASLPYRMNRGEAVTYPPEAEALFRYAEQLRVATRGAFSLTWRGGSLVHAPPAWRVEGGEVDLGGVLKGFLVDRAAEALRPWENFVVDAAGDVRAGGSEVAGGRGWRVGVVDEGGNLVTTTRLVEEALSTSGSGRQPDHIVDPRTGTPARCYRTVSVVAATALEADGAATATFVSCGWLPATDTLVVPLEGTPWQQGRRFRGVSRRSPS